MRREKLETQEDRLVDSLTDDIVEARSRVETRIEACRGSGRFTDDCLRLCGLLSLEGSDLTSAEDDLEKIVKIDRDPSRAMRRKDVEVWHAADWAESLDRVARTGCSEGPIEIPYDFGEIDGQRAAGISFACALAQTEQTPTEKSK